MIDKEEGKTIIQFQAGEDTEKFIQFIFNNIDDELIDNIDLKRIHDQKDGVASEALTTAAILTLSASTLSIVGRLIEKWLENERQTTHLKIMIQAQKYGSGDMSQFVELANKHADIILNTGFIETNERKEKKANWHLIIFAIFLIVVFSLFFFF